MARRSKWQSGASAGGLSLVLLVLAAHTGDHVAECQADEDKAAAQAADETAEPPFPSLTTSRYWDSQTFKIVSETIAKDRPITTQEEYLDLRLGLAAYVLTDSQEVVYSSLHEQLVLKYKPYTCEAFGLKASVFPDKLDDWSSLFGGYVTEETLQLRLFGVAAMWSWLELQSKVYTRPKANSELTGDIYTQRHVWAAVDEGRGVKVEFCFVSHSKEANAELSLVSVRLTRHGDDQLMRTINVLSIERTLEQHIYESLLALPLGYDCAKVYSGTGALNDGTQLADGTQDDQHDDSLWNSYAWRNSFVSLEVTATRMEPSLSTDTLVVEVAHAPIGQSVAAGEELGDLVMTKIKSSKQETKTILNHLYSVKYHVDLQRATCDISHLPLGDSKALADETYGDVYLEFANGLRLNIGQRRLGEMFASSKGLFKRVRSYRRVVGENMGRLYEVYERTTFVWPDTLTTGDGRAQSVVAREMQTLVMSETMVKTDSGHYQIKAMSEWKIHSNTIWLLDQETQTKILAAFQINVIDEEGPLGVWPDQAALFDVSEECYLNDPAKKAGRDYAWAELFYPLASNQLDLLVEQELKLKQLVYDNLMRMPLVTSFSLPRLELMFSDEGLVVRLLMLDLPTVELLLESVDNRALKVTKSVKEFTVADLRHCSKLCQMYACLTMTFCPESRRCLVSPLASETFGTLDNQALRGPALEQATGCVSFGTKRTALLSTLRKQRLSSLISALQHQDYDDIRLPAMPEEVALPREETGVSKFDYQKVLGRYINEVDNYLLNQDHRIPALTISFMLRDRYVAALPTKFTVENDPLEEMALGFTANPVDGDAVPASQDSALFDLGQIDSFFHAGLPGKRFDVNQLMGKPLGLRLVQGLSYDQCALACLDTKCGSFSHCATSSECVLTNLATLDQTTGLVLDDRDCLLSQRDFIQNFQAFPGVAEPAPAEVRKERPAHTANDCALYCVRETHFTCLSFEFCPSPQEDKMSTCYEHDTRHPDSIFAAGRASGGALRNDKSERGQAEGGAGKQASCDHYERSALAEFTHIEGRAIVPDELAKLKTSELLGKTTFECADACLNELADCSAFQFCFEPTTKRGRTRFAQSCRLVQSRPQDETERRELEVLVDTRDDRDTEVRPSRLLVQNSNCQVFALKPNSVQAHLRDLAMGQTMTRLEQEELARRAQPGGGHSFTWPGFLFLILCLMSASTVAGYGLSWAYANNERFRTQVDQLGVRLKL